jgi:hypothetical protein
MLDWHTSVLNLESAAYILSLRVRQAFWDYARLADDHSSLSDEQRCSFDVDNLFLYCRFFSAFLGSWNMARAWSLRSIGCRRFTITDTKLVYYLGFAMRWLCPSNDQPGGTGTGFPLQRESGRLPKTGRRPPSLVKEGRVMFLFSSTTDIPPVFSMVVLSNCGPRSAVAYDVLDETKPNSDIEVVGEQSMSIMQLVLVNILENVWYQGWVSLLDEIDDSVTLQVGTIQCLPLQNVWVIG